MKGVITGDIINSRDVSPEIWVPNLKEALQLFGNESTHWEIYRGDSFQLVIGAEQALHAAFTIKATIKMDKKLDVRMAIGIGDINFKGEKITHGNGTAFINSGEKFEELKKNTLAIKSDFPDFDSWLNVTLDLAMFVANSWKPITAEVIRHALQKPEMNQSQLAEQLHKKSQSTISDALKRGGYEEITGLLSLYKNKIEKL